MRSFPMKTSYNEKASRVEMIIRIPFMVLLSLYVSLLYIASFVAFPLQFVHILLHGRRNKTLHSVIKLLVENVYGAYTYMYFVSDKRPWGHGKAKLAWKEKASRSELIVRIIYAPFLFVIYSTFSMLFIGTWVLQFLYISFAGRRSHVLHLFNEAFIGYEVRAVAYLLMGTDERARVIPEELRAELIPDWFLNAIVFVTGAMTLFYIFVAPSSFSSPMKAIGLGAVLVGFWFILLAWSFASINPFAGTKPRKLQTRGPFAYVRHPLYSGLISLVLGLNLIFGCNPSMPYFVMFIIGLALKATKEELLLREKFDKKWDAYERRIGCFIPKML